MSSCWWQITIHCCRTCYVMNDTKNAVCNLSTFPVVIIYCWKAYWFLRLFPTVFSAVYAQVNLWKQQWGREREVIHVFYPASKRSINSEGSELRENVRVSGEAARTTRVSSRVTSRDSPNGELTHRLQVFMNPYRLYCVFWKCFNKWWLGL